MGRVCREKVSKIYSACVGKYMYIYTGAWLARNNKDQVDQSILIIYTYIIYIVDLLL